MNALNFVVAVQYVHVYESAGARVELNNEEKQD